MSDTDPVTDSPTVRDRLLAAGLSEERIDWWLSLEPGAVRVDGQPVVDGDQPAPAPARITLH